MTAAAALLTARSAVLAVALGIGVLLVIAGALRMSSRYKATVPDEPAEGVPTMRRYIPVAELPDAAELAEWAALPSVVPAHEMPPVSPDPRKES